MSTSLIVGGSSGVGLASAIRLAARGGTVHIAGRLPERLAAAIQNSCHKLDASDAAAVAAGSSHPASATAYRWPIRCIICPMATHRHASGRVPLTLESIVDAAVRIADHDGLEAVSIRSVAAALQARPMSLYSFIASKDDLVARMLDAVMGEIVLEDIPDQWREALFSIARRTIQTGARHPWIVAASLQSDSPGPNVLMHTKQTLDVLSGIGVHDEQARRLATAIDIYVIGFATLWKDGSDAPADDRLFTDGLTWLLDGFEHQRSE